MIKDTDFCNMSFDELCAVNDYGGDIRLYACLTNIFTNYPDKDEDMELTNQYTRPFLKHLLSRQLAKMLPAIVEQEHDQFVFKGFPNGDYIR